MCNTENCYHVFSHTLSVYLLSVWLISCSKQVTPLRNCSSIVVSSFLGVHLPLGCSRNKATVWKRQLSYTQGPTSSSHCKVHDDHVLVTWMEMCITNSFLRQNSWTKFLCRYTTPTGKCVAKMTWELAHWRWTAPPWQCGCSFYSVCANFPANKTTTIAPHPSGSRVSLHLCYFLKLNLAVKGWRFHDISMIKNSCKLNLQSSEHRS